MKKLLVILLFIPSVLVAEPISPHLAQQIAENFINAQDADSGISSHKAPRQQKRMARAQKQVTSDQQFYVFNSEDGEGFVIVAANDVVRPILGYSKTNSFNCDDIQDGMKWWLSEYSKQIKKAVNNNVSPSEKVVAEWSVYKTNSSLYATEVVSPLVTTKWDQAPYYNDLCPYNIFAAATNFHTLTGCAATALAQVMKYWEWPQIGDGYHSYPTTWYGTQSANFGATYYGWSNMPNQLASYSSATDKNAVATLMYHCGVAMDMDYGYNISGIREAGQVVNAVTSYFRYSPSTRAIHKSDYSEANWISIIKAQLDASKPMVYLGKGTGGGHVFVCDGYDSQDYFHFNWGWSGDKDGFYPVTDLAPGPNGYGSGTTGDFTAEQWAIVDMVPRTASSNVANLQLNSNWYLSSDSIPYGGTLAAAVSIKNYGTTSFVGDIIAMVLDKDGNYFADYTILENITIARNATRTINPSVTRNAGLVPGRYYVALFCRSDDLGYQIIGAEYYQNLTTFKVYHQADLEMFSDIAIYSNDNNELIDGHTAQISATLKNTGSSYFSGRVGLVLYSADFSSGQNFDEINMSIAGIGVGSSRTLTFSGTIDLEPGTYILALAYGTNNEDLNFVGSTYYSNPIYVIVKAEGEELPDIPDDPQPQSNRFVVLAQRNASSNWFYMTSDLGTANTKRYQGEDTGTNILANVVVTGLDDKYYWEIEDAKLKTSAGYSTWTSGNSANLDMVGKDLTITLNADDTYTFSFTDGADTRRLALNADSRYNYFAYYKGANHAYNLKFLPEDGHSTPTVIHNVSVSQPSAKKILRDGHIYILRGDKVYTSQGQVIE